MRRPETWPLSVKTPVFDSAARIAQSGGRGETGGSRRSSCPGSPVASRSAGAARRRGALRRGSDHGHSAVDVEGLAGDIGRFGAGEIDDRPRHVAAGSETTGRDQSQQFFLL